MIGIKTITRVSTASEENLTKCEVIRKNTFFCVIDERFVTIDSSALLLSPRK
jgi:hypothetical protein